MIEENAETVVVVENETPVVEAAPETPVVVEIPEKEYAYQPKDEHGRAYGRPQVLKYRTEDELRDKLVDQNCKLVAALREQTKKNHLGVLADDNLPDGAVRMEVPLQFNPRELSADERYQLAQDLMDPSKFDEALSTLQEATMGAKPVDVARAISSMQSDNLRILAKTESDAFMASTPEYYRCNDNRDTLLAWMAKNNLAPLRQNFRMAFDHFNDQGLMLTAPDQVRVEAPVVVETPVTVTVEEVPEREELPVREVVEEAPKKPAVKVATGFTKSSTSTVAEVGPKAEKYTRKDIDKLSAADYKTKLLKEKGFAELVDRYAAEDAARGRR